MVLGAGFAGLEVTTRLADEFGDEVHVTLIDKSEAFEMLTMPRLRRFRGRDRIERRRFERFSRMVHRCRECPRKESNLRTRFRKPVLYPLSYGGK